MRVFHGTIITCDEDCHVFNYLVEDMGKIIHVGDDLPQIYANSEQVELGEKALIPSFGDGHIHFSNWALIAASFFDIRSAQNFSETGAMIQAFIENNKKSKLVLCFGASKHSVEEKRLITREELDEFCSDKPLIVFCYDGHSCIINSHLLNKLPNNIHKMRGFNKDTGQLFNEAYYAATDFATSMIPALTLIKSIIKGYDLLAQNGVGMIHPVEGIGFPMDIDVTLVSLIARAQTKKNNFQTRLFFQTMDVKKF